MSYVFITMTYSLRGAGSQGALVPHLPRVSQQAKAATPEGNHPGTSLSGARQPKEIFANAALEKRR